MIKKFIPRFVFKFYYSLTRFLNYRKYHRLIEKNNLILNIEKKEKLIFKEILYIELFKTLRSELGWLKTEIIPIGGAIDFKLAYLLLRLLKDFKFKKIIEFGAGQSTYIIHDYLSVNNINAFTIENNKFWYSKIQKEIKNRNHQVIHSELLEIKNTELDNFYWYNSNDLPKNNRFDFFLIDGPLGTKKYSRVGFIDFFLENKSTDFIIVMDDLQRVGELQTFIFLLKKLETKNIKYHYKLIHGFKSLGIIFTSKYSQIKFYF